MINLKSGEHFTEPSASSQMTRGGFLKGILASGIAPSITLATIANAGSANATVGRSMMRNVGARQAAIFGGGWKNPYVTDGLVAMWDGEWNAGGGVHADSMLTWKDLSSHHRDVSLKREVSVGENFLQMPSELAFGTFTPFTPRTIDAVFLATGNAASPILQFNSNSVGGPEFRCRWIGLRANKTINFGQGLNAFDFGLFIGNITSVSAKFSNADFNTEPHSVKINGLNASTTSSGMTNANTFLGAFNTVSSYGLWSVKWYSIRCYSIELTDVQLSSNYAIDKARFNLP